MLKESNGLFLFLKKLENNKVEKGNILWYIGNKRGISKIYRKE